MTCPTSARLAAALPTGNNRSSGSAGSGPALASASGSSGSSEPAAEAAAEAAAAAGEGRPRGGDDAAAPAALPPLLRQLYRGALGLEGLSLLLRRLGRVEHTVAAGQSLLQRLAPPVAGSGDAQVAGETGSAAGAFAWEAANALVASALGLPPLPAAPAAAAGALQKPPLYGTAWVVPPGAAARGSLRALMTAHARAAGWGSEADSDRLGEDGADAEAEAGVGGGGASASESGGDNAAGGHAAAEAGGAVPAAAAGWPRPFLKEWLYQVLVPAQAGAGGQQQQQQQESQQGHSGGGSQDREEPSSTAYQQRSQQPQQQSKQQQPQQPRQVRHRLYVKALPAELRMATVVTSGTSGLAPV